MTNYRPEERRYINIHSPEGTYMVSLLYVSKIKAEKEYPDMVDSDSYLLEIIAVYTDDMAGILWMLKYMGWGYVKRVAIKVNDEKTITEDEFWTTTDHFEIVTEAEG